jgi:hypothetical protein
LKSLYSTTILTPSEWLANSGAYMHWMLVIPFEKVPLWVTFIGYSNTQVPFLKELKKKFTEASLMLS